MPIPRPRQIRERLLTQDRLAGSLGRDNDMRVERGILGSSLADGPFLSRTPGELGPDDRSGEWDVVRGGRVSLQESLQSPFYRHHDRQGANFSQKAVQSVGCLFFIPDLGR